MSKALFERTERKFGSLAELPSNIEALDAGHMFATGNMPFVVIVGPSGWGKTHLLDCVRNSMARTWDRPVAIEGVLDWIEGRSQVDPVAPILVDNVQDATGRSRSRLQLRLALERRVRIGRPVLLAMTGERLTRQLYSFLPLPREWHLAEIGEPSFTERRIIVEKMAETEGLEISKTLVKLLAFRMKGNGNTLHGALNRLRLAGTNWSQPEDVIRAIGMLDPFFADNSSWDLKERLRVAAARAQEVWPELSLNDLCCYSLLQVAQLSELDVARFCGVPPAKARACSLRFQKLLVESEKTYSAYRQFTEIALESVFES